MIGAVTKNRNLFNCFLPSNLSYRTSTVVSIIIQHMQSRKVGYTNGVIRNLIEEGQTIQCLKEKERKDKQ